MIDKLQSKLNQECDIMYNLLLANGVKPKDKKLSTLVNSIRELYCIHPRKHYCGVILDEFGYVKEIVELSDVAEFNPSDKYITKGFYKIENHKLVLDEKRKLELYPDKVTF